MAYWMEYLRLITVMSYQIATGVLGQITQVNYPEFGGAYDLYTLEAGMFTYALNSTVDHVVTMGSIQRKLPPKLNNLDDKSQYSVYFSVRSNQLF